MFYFIYQCLQIKNNIRCTYPIYIALDAFFNQKISIFFLFLDKNIRCRYSLEAPRGGASNEYPERMFSSINKKIRKLFTLYPFLYRPMI